MQSVKNCNQIALTLSPLIFSRSHSGHLVFDAFEYQVLQLQKIPFCTFWTYATFFRKNRQNIKYHIHQGGQGNSECYVYCICSPRIYHSDQIEHQRPSRDTRDGTTRAHTFQGTGGNTYTQMSTIVKLHTFSLYYL